MTLASVGGKVVDASALARMLRGWHSALTWLDVARLNLLTLYVPALALAEVRAVLPESTQRLAELLILPQLIVEELDASSADAVAALLDDRGAFDALAGHVVYIARLRGWPILSVDHDRLRRLDPDVEIDDI